MEYFKLGPRERQRECSYFDYSYVCSMLQLYSVYCLYCVSIVCLLMLSVLNDTDKIIIIAIDTYTH